MLSYKKPGKHSTTQLRPQSSKSNLNGKAEDHNAWRQILYSAAFPQIKNCFLPMCIYHVFVQESFMFLCLQRNKIFKVWCIVINFLWESWFWDSQGAANCHQTYFMITEYLAAFICPCQRWMTRASCWFPFQRSSLLLPWFPTNSSMTILGELTG